MVGTPSTFSGAAIYANTDSELEVKNSTFTNNIAVNGGAISFSGISLTVNKSKFYYNESRGILASHTGGGALNVVNNTSTSLTVTNSECRQYIEAVGRRDCHL
jgi:predicted outer membrane repeat protein